MPGRFSRALCAAFRRNRTSLVHLLLVLGFLAPKLAAIQTEVTQWRSGLIELDQGWVEHEGDNSEWSHPEFDDRTWQGVDLENIGPAQEGWRWYRRRVNFGPDHPEVRLLLSGGYGTYELYVNGNRVAGPRLRPSSLVSRPVETVFSLEDETGDFALALRTRVPPAYAAWHLPQFTSVTVGLPTAIEYERQALQGERLFGLAPSICINVLLYLAGIGCLALYANQRTQREYLLLGLYLLIVGISNGLAMLQSSGLAPLSANFLVADPLIYFCVIAQIEFTYCFAGRKIGSIWRIYEASLVLPLVLACLAWTGHFRSDTYALIEAAVTAPVGLLLSVLLFFWYRRGNREAGWLVLPSLAPAISNALLDLGTASIFLGWTRFNFLVQPIQMGPIALQLVDAGTLVFLLSIVVVMLIRFSRVSHEQARSAAELAAAREIQQLLVPNTIPAVQNCAIEAAYLPAREVGGDFYQVLPQADGSTMIVIGDVSGKGLRAAMTGTLAIGALRALAADISDPAQLLGRLNREIAQAHDGGFITCLCLRLDPNGEVAISNAGHLSPYQNGEELPLEAGLPLGLVPDLVYSQSRFSLGRGDSLTLLSDGVVEARDRSGALFGFDRTQALISRSAADIANAAKQFGQEDDITAVKITFGTLRA
jgi:phosphoserine phosphatase RsbU/P